MMFFKISPFSRPCSARHAFGGLLACGFTLLSLGCGAGPPAEFKFRATTEDLISDAKKSVKATLNDSFGTPNDLVAWERLPVAYGGINGTVESVTDDKSIVVKLDEEAGKIKHGTGVVWLTGGLSGEKSKPSHVAIFQNETSQLQLVNKGESPAAGDRFILGFGEQLQLGRHVYMKNCMHCHGVTGDGAGPTGEFLNPRPRDYRNGQFKFTSTRAGEKANRDDLHRIVAYGIPGTYMPSFLLLGDKETKAVIEYVRWLAIRGEFEKRLTAELSSDYSEKSIADSTAKANTAYAEKQKNKEEAERPPSLNKAIKTANGEFAKFAKEELPAVIEETVDILAQAWTRAEEADSIIVPTVQRVEDTVASRERGRLLYMSDKTKCYTCHGETGRGDGGATEDFWPKPGSTEKYANRGLHDEWGNQLKPRNLTLGQYRGGRRPVDLFRRMYAGIKGTPMPAFGGTALKDEEIWDLVNFVMSLPYSRPPSPAAPGGNMAKLDEKPAH
ncbi:c-type cytochrome [Schlesneria paludicola]|uniref:c-type cytochrome n=1 Tax=Schlesneria paludicola TaxID=360056 RepID=UPI00029AB8E9|nr:cytochrome c [Schlesneria paludicola]